MSERLATQARKWGVVVEETLETSTSLIAFGRHDSDSVVLKLVKAPGDEWRSGEVLHAFGARGVVGVREFTGGAMLLDRLQPGHSLCDLSLSGRDDEATAILADVISAMSPSASMEEWPSVNDWGRSLERYAASGQERISPALVAESASWYERLGNSQTRPRLLHGDLQHSNVLYDNVRGWVAIDPKGVVGELEFEIGAALRNPVEQPDLFADPAVIERRVRMFAARLPIDVERVLGWTFAQAVLSAIWEIEDGFFESPLSSLRLAEAVRPMLRNRL